MAVDLAKLDVDTPHVQCKTCLVLADLDKKNADYLRGMIVNPAKSDRHVSDVLAKAGIKISKSSVRDHRVNHA